MTACAPCAEAMLPATTPISAVTNSIYNPASATLNLCKFFKVPSLRNLKFTTPYMHDGRFAAIDEVLDHYATGVQQTLHHLGY